jgi:hypothetical protein
VDKIRSVASASAIDCRSPSLSAAAISFMRTGLGNIGLGQEQAVSHRRLLDSLRLPIERAGAIDSVYGGSTYRAVTLPNGKERG